MRRSPSVALMRLPVVNCTATLPFEHGTGIAGGYQQRSPGQCFTRSSPVAYRVGPAIDGDKNFRPFSTSASPSEASVLHPRGVLRRRDRTGAVLPSTTVDLPTVNSPIQFSDPKAKSPTFTLPCPVPSRSRASPCCCRHDRRRPHRQDDAAGLHRQPRPPRRGSGRPL